MKKMAAAELTYQTENVRHDLVEIVLLAFLAGF